MSEEQKPSISGLAISPEKIMDWVARIAIAVILLYITNFNAAIDRNTVAIMEVQTKQAVNEANRFTSQDGVALQQIILQQVLPRLDNMEKCLIKFSNNARCTEFD